MPFETWNNNNGIVTSLLIKYSTSYHVTELTLPRDVNPSVENVTVIHMKYKNKTFVTFRVQRCTRWF